MTRHFSSRHRWLFSLAALFVWAVIGARVVESIVTATPLRGSLVSPLWLVPFALCGLAMLGSMTLRLSKVQWWSLIAVQFVSILAMIVLLNWSLMAMFLVPLAWQVGFALPALRAVGLVLAQTIVANLVLAIVPNPDLCWVNWMAFGLQMSTLVTAVALRREAETAEALASAHAVIANNARDAERTRISRELHDAWGHELTALGLQLEIASHVSDLGRANDHVLKARGLASELLGKVRDVVSTLREAERCDLKQALEALAERVPSPAVHVDVSSRVQLTPDQAYALMRCAQEAVTNAVRHSQAKNLWLQVASDEGGVRLIAQDDGAARPAPSKAGSGLRGMRERVELLGGKLAVRKERGAGFTVDAWLPLGPPQPA
ncbi:sensor histidine kinase [Sphingomonas sabuli]|uniref:Sensor histidine kinase n=1 Tax=Sphingomonas sabuli TaxID=2764186 RepID=A0A7G9L1Y0_9SPHN|nr:sensor histidine kinase [Sphingomonas sabuli]QNM82629.1 sensor histidine kinase [Sphingomonas sabuli]